MARYRRAKIKRTRTRLYKKKKSTRRKVFETILLIIVIGGLGFLGYCVAEPLMNYFKGGNSQDDPVITSWEPEETTVSDAVTSDATEATTTTTVPETIKNTGYYFSEKALTSEATLNSEISAAKNAGAKTVYVLLKDANGSLLYSTNSSVKGSKLVKGTLTLDKITSAINAEGLTAVAVMNTLLDKTTPGNIDGTGYRWANGSYAWLDAAADKGGKQWVDPFKTETTEYFSELIEEITKSGFKTVVLKNTIYPQFLDYDKTILDAHFFDEKRHEALGKLVSALSKTAAENSATVQLEADLKEAFSLSGTAEILKSAEIAGVTVNFVYNADDFSNELDTGTEKITLPTSQKEKIVKIFELASKLSALSSHQIVPVINSESLTPDAVSETLKALTSEGYFLAASK